MNHSKIFKILIDFIVPFGAFLRNVDPDRPFKRWVEVLIRLVPQTFFIYWIFSLIPVAGTLVYILSFIPLSIRQHFIENRIKEKTDKLKILLWYYVVILFGFGGVWSFIGHTFMADMVATKIGWPIGSPFQTELAFYTLGTSIAAFISIWLRGHMITALVISKSVFWYGAAYVHIKDMIINNNYEPYNVGLTLLGDLVFPSVFITILILILKDNLEAFNKLSF
ncbi:hypothetical protein BFP77_01820 [Maribacter sp. 4U21]|uniref:DUF6790 family protein n=1 Tax=Maribacter sp. 4U21 TaxID=1889779 RepID=UPI000C14C51E|nr:DUF6790 family protein [Maribacter sp. 4U21]PIB31330.1 hypothetical protein BFP77_01820 [Maribacter sp. 4U21]